MSVRLDALRLKLAELEVDALLVSQPENRRYLSGFTGSAGVLIISAEHAILATDFRYYDQARRQASDFRLAEVGYDFVKALPALLSEIGARRAGFESQSLTVAQHAAWTQAAPQAEWESTSGVVEGLRMVKDAAELASLRAAAALADQAFATVAQRLRPGLTEREVAWDLERMLHELGADRPAFEIMVNSGPNAALPHLRPTDRRIQAGEPIVVDMGAVLDGYHSDMTRTLCLGSPDARYREIYQIVLEAQLAAERALRPGTGGQDIDRLARSAIEAAGYGPQFGHGLGHGTGLAVHEGPRLGQASRDLLLPDMVVTVEPGIYLPGWGGVRIEDLVRVTADGVEVLSGTPKDLP